MITKSRLGPLVIPSLEKKVLHRQISDLRFREFKIRRQSQETILVQKKMIKNIILDVNDVLVSRDILHTNKVLAEKYNLPFFMPGQRQDFEDMKAGEITLEEFLKRTSKKHGGNTKEIFEIIINQVVEDAVLHEKLINYIKSLDSSFGVAILSHSNPIRNEADKRIGLMNITSNMFFLIGKSYTKTETDSFEYLLKEMKWKAEECVFIDDKEKHLIVARSLGIKTILATSEDKTLKELKVVLN